MTIRWSGSDLWTGVEGAPWRGEGVGKPGLIVIYVNNDNNDNNDNNNDNDNNLTWLDPDWQPIQTGQKTGSSKTLKKAKILNWLLKADYYKWSSDDTVR